MENSQDFVFAQHSFGKAERAVLVQDVAWASAAGERAHPNCVLDVRMRYKKERNQREFGPSIIRLEDNF